jgi:hypothetical protein
MCATSDGSPGCPRLARRLRLSWTDRIGAALGSAVITLALAGPDA